MLSAVCSGLPSQQGWLVGSMLLLPARDRVLVLKIVQKGNSLYNCMTLTDYVSDYY